MQSSVTPWQKHFNCMLRIDFCRRSGRQNVPALVQPGEGRRANNMRLILSSFSRPNHPKTWSSKREKTTNNGAHWRPRNRHAHHHRGSRRRNSRNIWQGMVQILHSSSAYHCFFGDTCEHWSLHAVGNCSLEKEAWASHESVWSSWSKLCLAKTDRVKIIQVPREKHCKG